jgi:broad specificity phosphatase PhoE
LTRRAASGIFSPVPTLRRILLVRHGETDGESSRRFHGAGDVDLSEVGRAQMRAVLGGLAGEVVDLVVASPLRRSWRSACLLAPGAPVRLEADFREIHFGRWEGRSAEEIRASDPILYEDWQAGREGFEYPNGEPRARFRERVARGLERVLAADARGALLVVHKGVIRIIVERLTGEPLERSRPGLGELLGFSRDPDGRWFPGRRSSDPPALRSGR